MITDAPFNDEQGWIELGIGGAGAKLVRFTPDEHRDRVGMRSNVTFWSPTIQETYEELKTPGLEFVVEPKRSDCAAFFKDSVSNVFALSSCPTLAQCRPVWGFV